MILLWLGPCSTQHRPQCFHHANRICWRKVSSKWQGGVQSWGEHWRLTLPGFIAQFWDRPRVTTFYIGDASYHIVNMDSRDTCPLHYEQVRHYEIRVRAWHYVVQTKLRPLSGGTTQSNWWLTRTSSLSWGSLPLPSLWSKVHDPLHLQGCPLSYMNTWADLNVIGAAITLSLKIPVSVAQALVDTLAALL